MTRDEALLVLGVSSEAGSEEVDAAYRRLMRTVHPDVCRGPEAGRLSRQAGVARQLLNSGDLPSAAGGAAVHNPVSPPSQSSSGDPSASSPASASPVDVVVDDDQLARMVLSILGVAGGSLSHPELLRAALDAVHTASLSPAVRFAARSRLRSPEFWMFGRRTGLWHFYNDDVVLPRVTLPRRGRRRSASTSPFFRRRAQVPAGFAWLLGLACLGAVVVLSFPFVRSLDLRRVAAVPGLVPETGVSPRTPGSSLDLPRWTHLAFALDPEFAGFAAMSSYRCGGLVLASASVVSVGVDQPFEVCGFSPSVGEWRRVTGDDELSLSTAGSRAAVQLSDGRVLAVAPGRVDVTAAYGRLSGSLALQVLPLRRPGDSGGSPVIEPVAR